MVTEQSKSKSELIAASVSGLAPQDWMIGDTGKDIQVGHTLGIKTCAVLSGFLNAESVRPYRPDVMKPTVADFHL
jgi:phosphoglycolate phosphatase